MASGSERERVMVALKQERSKVAGPLQRSLRSLAILRALALRAVDKKADNLVSGPGAIAIAVRVGITGR